MGIFTRFKDIVSSNINAMLDKAEDPDKLIRLMIREIEETLVELKASCAGHMATRTKLERDLQGLRDKSETWMSRAELAVSRGRDDLAREALEERKHLNHQLGVLDKDLATTDQLVSQCQEDITLLEEKLQAARDKQRTLAKRHDRARERTRCRREARRMEHHDAWRRFELFEQRVDRLEAEAAIEERPARGHLEQAFSEMERDEDVERELSRLKAEAAAR